MLELFTGIPGSGKSLANVHRLHGLQKAWGADPSKARPVFVHNIPDLLLPHAIVPLKQYQASPKVPAQWVVDWDAMPDHSIVLIDECAMLFPPRSSASAMPPHIEFLTVHRKRGFDIWFTTQNPKFVDHSLRALVGRHQYFRRMFGMQRSVIYEWDACSDSHSGTKEAVKTVFNFPKSSFKYYKSAEIHTTQHFRLPLWLFIPVLGILLGLYFVPRAFGVLHNGISGKAIAPDAVASPAAVSPVVLPAPVPPAAIPDDLKISACLATAARCQCFSHAGIHLDMPDAACREAADHPTASFRPAIALATVSDAPVR